jgi:hypothetical protein
VTPDRIRVVQWGCGNTGSVALKAIIESAELELVGLWVHNADHVGRDAGELAGVEIVTRVEATSDVDAVVALDADCVCYMASDRNRQDDVIDDVCGLLGRGVNVVATTMPVLVHPSGAGPDVQRRLEAACQEGNSSYFCTGIEPGFMADALVLHLTSLSRDIAGIRVQEAMNVGGYRVKQWRSGLGGDVTTDAQRYQPGSIARSWAGPMAMLAAGLGVTLNRVFERRELAAAGREFTVPAGTYGPQDAAALHFEVIGEVDGRELFVIEHCYRLIDDVAPHWPQPVSSDRRTTRVRISGTPNIDVDIALGGDGLDATAQGVLATAMRAVNAIPVVTRASQGAYSAIELPIITGYGRQTKSPAPAHTAPVA